MLQIASGKLFRKKPGQRNELRGVLYTNLRVYDRVIETSAGRLLSTSNLHDSKTLVYELAELIEDDPGPGVIASHGIDPYLSDFATVVSFVLNVTCTPDHDLTLRLLSGRPSPSVQFPPNKLVARAFDDMVWCQPRDEIQLFEMVAQLISLKRESFLAAMRSIRSYVTGLHRLADDHELAYTLLVVAIESLAPEFDDSNPQWSDYDQRKRLAIDKALVGADEGLATRVREALLATEHVALGRRFREFALEHLEPSYFRKEAQGLVNPVGYSDLEVALRQAYNLRSDYVHELAELPAILKLPGFGDTAPLGRQAVLTFQGLARLARHVIATFIQRQPKVHREAYDYRLELPGVARVELEPRYWVGRADNLHNNAGRRRLEGFLKQATACLLQGEGASVTNLRDVLLEVERMLPQMSAHQRRPFIALYILFNTMALGNGKMDQFEGLTKHYWDEFSQPEIESMLSFLVLGIVPEWSLSEHREVHDTYFREKHHKNGLRVPPALEAGLCLTLAEHYRLAGDVVQARALITSAAENHPGHAPLLDLEQNFDPAQEINWMNTVRPPRVDEDDKDPAAATGDRDAKGATSEMFGKP